MVLTNMCCWPMGVLKEEWRTSSYLSGAARDGFEPGRGIEEGDQSSLSM